MRTWTAGDLVSAAMLNANVRDLGTFNLTYSPRAALRQGSIQAIANVTWTSIAFDVEDFDNDGAHSTTTLNSRYTAQTAGWYEVSGFIGFAANSTGQRQTRWTANGAAIPASGVSINATGSGTTHFSAGTVNVFLAVNDYVELQVWQNSTISVNTAASAEFAPRMNVKWIGN